VFFLGAALLVEGLNFEQTGIETGVGNNFRGPPVIGVAIIQGIGQYDAGPAATDDGDYLAQRFFVVPDKTVGQVKVLPETSAKFGGRIGGLPGTDCGAAPAAELSPRQVEQTNGVALFKVAQEGAGGGKFDVVRMYANGENIYLHGAKVGLLAHNSKPMHPRPRLH